MEWLRKDLLGLEDLSAEEILMVLDVAQALHDVATRKVPKLDVLQGAVVANVFFEPSTRTINSFSVAARRLGADLINFSRAGSSAQKGETLKDTARNIEAMGIDFCVVRHSGAGAPWILARALQAGVINAGDGCHEHPTQALLDLFTIRRHKGRFEGLHVAIVGDIAHSRVARSDIWGLLKLGARVTVVGPSTLLPREMARMGVAVSHQIDEVIPQCDVLNALRIQFERDEAIPLPSLREYARLFQINPARLARAKDDVLMMHPGPMNRGLEIAPEVADGSRSVILEQVTNGVAVRMAILYLLSGRDPKDIPKLLKKSG